MQVNTAPAWARSLLAVYGMVLAAAWYLLMLLLRPTIRVAVMQAGRIPPTGNGVYCHWHQAIPLLLQASTPRLPAVLARRPHAWLQHPLWHMKPVHVLLRMVGVRRIVLGSTGHGGRAAADELVRLLQRGYSTMVFPDGPAGPPREVHPGVLHIAQQSGVPIVPLRVEGSRVYRAPGWDRKMFPLPFSTITLLVGSPVTVSPDADISSLRETLRTALG